MHIENITDDKEEQRLLESILNEKFSLEEEEDGDGSLTSSFFSKRLYSLL